MKKYILTILTCLVVSCNTYTTGNYTIKTFEDGVENRVTAEAVQIIDETNTVKYKKEGKVYKFTGSFEVYED